MNAAKTTIVETLNEAKKPYNEKLTVAIEISRTKEEFIEVAESLGILDFLTDAFEQENQSFDNWLEAFGIEIPENVS